MFEAVLVALADHGFTPVGDRGPAHPDRGARVGAGRAVGRAARRRLAVSRGHRGLRPVPGGARWPRTTARRRPTTRAGTRSRRGRAGPAGAGGLVPGLGHPIHKDGDPRTPVMFPIAAEAGCIGPAPEAVRGHRPGAPGHPRPDTAAQRRRGVRGGAGRPRLRRPTCCAASPCWPGRRACSATWPRRCATRPARDLPPGRGGRASTPAPASRFGVGPRRRPGSVDPGEPAPAGRPPGVRLDDRPWAGR